MSVNPQPTTRPFVSVIIPVHNDFEGLQRCLRGLEAQDYPFTSLEVLVVDNGSTEDSTETQRLFPWVKFLKEMTPGPAAARNKGLEHAKGEIIALIDSDCIPSREWLSSGVSALNPKQNIKIIGGRIPFRFQNPHQPNMVELYEYAFELDQKRRIEWHNVCPTANLFTYRSVFEHVGYFDPKYLSFEDHNWSHRALDLGYTLHYSHEASVEHWARTSLRAIVSKRIRDTGGEFLRRKQKKIRGIPIPLIAFFFLLPRYLLSPFRAAAQAVESPSLDTVPKKLSVFLIDTLLNYLTFLEYLRLYAGGKPRRRGR
jgi:glycosyltransferase involved in cell wall biosynthesis